MSRSTSRGCWSLDPRELASTDAADHAIAALAAASITEVVVLGRRGPAQAAFTTPELRELGELARVDVIVDPAELDVAVPATRPPRPRAATWPSCASCGADGRAGARTGSSCASAARRSRSSATGDGPVTGLRVVRNRLEETRRVRGGHRRARGDPLRARDPLDRLPRPAAAGVPFDERRGLIRTDGGRVCEPDGTPRTGEYAVGWIKRGPSGVIGTNKKCAADTVARLLEDLAARPADRAAGAGGEAIEAWLRSRVPGVVGWRGWQAIDEHERALGAPRGRPRVKLVRVSGHACGGRPRSPV